MSLACCACTHTHTTITSWGDAEHYDNAFDTDGGGEELETHNQPHEQQESASVLETELHISQAESLSVLKAMLRMQQNLERSWEEIRFARSDKRFSPSGPRSFMGMTDKTIFVVPDVLLQKCKNKAGAKKVYQSITKQRSDEDYEPPQLLRSPGLLLLVQ